MASNGLSSRRKTLKRPIVCKNDYAKNCGACTMTASIPGGPWSPGASFIIQVLIDCDPDPIESVAVITLEEGGEIVVDPEPRQINEPFTENWNAAQTSGTHRITLLAEQSTGCYWTTHVDYVVQ